MPREKKLNSRLEGIFGGLGERAKPALPAGARLPGVADSLDPLAVVPGWTWELDATGAIAACSPDVTNHLGYTPGELIGKPLWALAGSRSASAARELAQSLEERRPLVDLRLPMRHKNGADILVVLSALPKQDDTGDLLGFISVVQVAQGAGSAASAMPSPLKTEQTAPARPVEPPTPRASPPPPLPPPVAPTAPSIQPAAPAQPSRELANGHAADAIVSWGYLASPDGVQPIGSWSAPELEAALDQGRLVLRAPGDTAGAGGRALAVPIRLQNQTLGALDFFDDDEVRTWSDDDLALVQAVADQLGLALENAQLLGQISQERVRLAVLYDVLQALITRPDREAIFETALQMAPRLGAQHAYVLLLGEREFDATFRGTVPGLERLGPREARDLALTLAREGLERWVLDNHRAAVVRDTRADERWYTTPGHVESEPARSVISVPLQTQRGSLTGVLAYTHTEPAALGDEQLALIESIAGQVAVALENALLRQRQGVQNYNAAALARTAQALTSTLNESELHQIVADQLVQAFDPNGVVVLRWDPATNNFTTLAVEVSPFEAEADRAAWPVPGSSFPAVVGRPDLLQVVRSRQGRVQAMRDEGGDQSRESMALPLLYGGEVEGVVEIVRTGGVGGPTAADLELFQAILTATASALQSARLYELQRQTAERLAEVDRLKSQFLANMSHELRTPLNSIIGFSRVILKGIDGPLSDLQQQDLTSINNAGQHLLGLINDILDMARIEAGKMELVLDEIDLHDTFKGVMSTTVALIKDKQVTLHEQVAPDLPKVRADAMRIRQVLLNLLANAAKFTDEGSITLRAQSVEAAGPNSGRLEPFVEISVIDTGPGISAEDMTKLFEPFSQVDASATRKVGGTGLGLSICRQLVELHNGRIWVESEVGRGSIFTFVLPVSRQEPEARPTALAAPEPAPEPDRLVLAVDDDLGIANLYRRYLEPHGFRVVGVSKSTEAITRAAELRPVAILLDVLMPNKDGWQVLAELKRSEITRDIPVIMCTLVTDTDRAYGLGAVDYLNKPILEADLLRALRKLPALANGRSATVLIIEDRLEDAAFLRRAVSENAGGPGTLRVLEAQDGQTGLTLARNQRPQAIILDLLMPDLDGFQVLALLRSDPITRDIPIIVVTAAELGAGEHARLTRQVAALHQKGAFSADELYQDLQRVIAARA